MDGANDRYSLSNTAGSRRMKIEAARRMMTKGTPTLQRQSSERSPIHGQMTCKRNSCLP
jgi:hypothetical protein